MGRIVGLDLARFVAIVGMMAAHLLVPRADVPYGELNWLTVVTSGYPSAMFAVIGGFGVFLTSRKYLAQGARGAAAVNLLVRGFLIAFIGILLNFLPDHQIAVILVFFGVAIACSAPLVALPSWVLATIAAVLPFISTIAGYHLMQHFLAKTVFDSGSALEALVVLFFTGYYPVTTWLAYLLIGVLCARFVVGATGPPHLRTPPNLRTRALYLALGGATIFATVQAVSSRVVDQAGSLLAQQWGMAPEQGLYAIVTMHRGTPLLPPPMNLALAAPHSGSPADVLASASAAIFVTALLIVLTAGLRVAPWPLRPFAWTGAAPLTIYSLHIILTASTWTVMGFAAGTWDGTYPTWFLQEFWIQLAIVVGVGTLIGALGRRGPLETFVSKVAALAAAPVQNADQRQLDNA